MGDILQARNIYQSTQGSIAIVTALTLMAMMMATGMAVDYISLMRQRAELQAAADAAAIAGAKEIPVASSDVTQIQTVAANFARANLGLGLSPPTPTSGGNPGSGPRKPTAPSMLTATSGAPGGGGSGGNGSGSVTINASVDTDDSSIEVQIEKPWTPYFAGLFNQGASTINVTARAQLYGDGKVCVLGLSDKDSSTISVNHTSMINAKNCGVFSNSTHADSIRVNGNGTIVASKICAVGGASGPGSAFNPSATTDCPPIGDPLKDRPEPSVGACDHTDLVIHNEMRVLSPGVYCDGLTVSGTGRVTFSPGAYVINGGKFLVKDSGYIRGINVGFYLADNNTLFEFTQQTSIDLTAPIAGELAGILFFETRAADLGREHRINSNDAKNLIGTIYLPRGRLLVDSNAPVASESAFTVIIANTIELLQNPNLVLNSDYSQTDVPVPGGLTDGFVVLKE